MQHAEEDLPSSPAPKTRKTSTWIIGLIGVAMVFTGAFLLRFEHTISAVGYVQKENEAKLFSPFDATVFQIAAHNGSDVRAGDALLDLDLKNLRSQYFALRREWSSSQRELRKKREELAIFENFPESLPRLLSPSRVQLLRKIHDLQEDIRLRYVQLDSDAVRPSLDQTRATIERLQTELNLLEAELYYQQEKEGWREFQKDQLKAAIENWESHIILLEDELESMNKWIEQGTLRSPKDGTVTWLSVRHPGELVQKGELVAKISQEESPYRVRAWVGQKNIDLLRIGTPVRMESQVYDSVFLGYIRGEVINVALEPNWNDRNQQIDDEPYYEVTISVQETPFPLVLGSRVKVQFLLGTQNLWQLIVPQSTSHREKPHE